MKIMKMKNSVPAIILSLLAALPIAASAGVSLAIAPAGITIHIGDRDHRGYYWDGYDWRAPKWWHEHHGCHQGEKGPRGYWNGNGWQAHPPVDREPRHEPQHERPIAHRDTHQRDRRPGDERLAAERHANGGPDHRPVAQPHG